MKTTCPACASTRCVPGRLLLSGTDDGWVTRFYPKGLRFLTLKKAVSLINGQSFSACLECGHVWNKLDPVELRALLEKNGDSSAKEILEGGR